MGGGEGERWRGAEEQVSLNYYNLGREGGGEARRNVESDCR